MYLLVNDMFVTTCKYIWWAQMQRRKKNFPLVVIFSMVTTTGSSWNFLHDW